MIQSARTRASTRRFYAILLAGLSMAIWSGCQSSKKTEDSLSADAGGSAAPQIESSAMNYDASGSDSGKIAGLETVHFDYDRSALASDAKKKIQGNVAWMQKNKDASLSIEGHCDGRGSNEYNIALGERRAKAVRDYMVSLGVSASRLSTVSYGEDKPLAMGESEADHKKNRRANFVPNK